MIFDMPNCGGCRTCAIACGFRHTGEFTPSASSLRIVDREDGQGYRVLLLERDQGCARACDGCRDLGEPLCVQYCHEAQELARMIQEFIRHVEPPLKQKARGTTSR